MYAAGLLEELRCADGGRRAAAVGECGEASASPSQTMSLLNAGVVQALVLLLGGADRREVGACCRSLARLAAASDACRSATLGAGALPQLVALLKLPSNKSDPTCGAAAACLGTLVSSQSAAKEAAVAAGAPDALVPLLSVVSDAATRQAAAETLCELVGDCGAAREALSACNGLRELARVLGSRDCGLDSPLGCALIHTLLRCAHSESLRAELREREVGKVAWSLLETKCSGGTVLPPPPSPASPPLSQPQAGSARPGSRLAALLLVTLLYCYPKDGNVGACRFANRLDVAAHVTAMVDAAAAQRGSGGCFDYLGCALWRSTDPVLYLRFLADNDAFAQQLDSLGAQGRLGALVSSGALGVAPPAVFEAMGAGISLGASGFSIAAQREMDKGAAAIASLGAALGAAAMCCVVPEGTARAPAGAEEGLRPGRATSV